MSLRKEQSEFVKCIGSLIEYAYSKNYELTFGDAYRDPRVHGPWGRKESYSSAYSVHKMKLACDFNLFVDNKYIQNYHAAWDDLGSYWKSLHKNACWGGDFSIRDYNHFSFSYGGFR